MWLVATHAFPSPSISSCCVCNWNNGSFAMDSEIGEIHSHCVSEHLIYRCALGKHENGTSGQPAISAGNEAFN